jgi:hypothetical protein
MPAQQREVGADQQVSTLLDRDPAAHALLYNPGAVAQLLQCLQAAGADQQAAALTDRLPAAGMWDLCPESCESRARFGRAQNSGS